MNQIDWKNKTLLLVEDNLFNAEYIIEALDETQIKIIHASTGEEAISLLKDNKDTNIILLDIRLPDTSGYNLIPLINEIVPNIPIIAQTAYVSNKDVEKCMEFGCRDFIAKPVLQGDLLNKISNIFI